jgi:hypothetical protein
VTGYSIVRTWISIYSVLCSELTEGWSYKEIRELTMALTKLAVEGK